MSAQRLYELDSSSILFPEQLDKLLCDKGWIDELKTLPEGDLVGLANHLNDILDSLDLTGSLFRKCLRLLRKICGSWAVLPSTYEVSDGLSVPATQPFAFGGFCDFYKGTLFGENVCVRRLRISITGDRLAVKKALCKETSVWKRLNHVNIVPFKGTTFEPLQLVSEWMDFGELREYLRTNHDADLINLSLGIANGIFYLHTCNVIHGDLKGANILIDRNGDPRVVDFGLATVARDTNSLDSTSDERGITARFTSPEVLKGVSRHSRESDVFAFGMVMIEVFTNKVPFSNWISATAIALIVSGQHPERPTHPSLTDHLWTLIQRCWLHDPRDRPPMSEVIEQLAKKDTRITPLQPVHLLRCETPEASPSPPSPTTRNDAMSLLFLPPPLPQAPVNFFGCDVIVDYLLGCVDRSESITLLGAGGTGKTAIALTLLHHTRILTRFGHHRYFMCCNGLESSLDEFLGRLSEVIGARDLKDMAQLLSHLSLYPPRILVVDGVERVLDPHAPGAVEIVSAIEEFSRCKNLCILLTSKMNFRIACSRCIEVPNLSANGAQDVFYGRCGLERSTDVNSLLEELDFHPLSIDLLAGAVSENGWDEATLLEEWDGGKASILKARGRQSLEDNIKSTLSTPTIRIHEMAALETLGALATLPTGIRERELTSTFPKIAGIGDATDALCKFFLVYRQDGYVKMLSPFRFYFQQTPVPRPGNDTAQNPAVGDIQHTQSDVTDSDKNFGLPSNALPGVANRTHTPLVTPTHAGGFLKAVDTGPGRQPTQRPRNASLKEMFQSATNRLQATFRLSAGSKRKSLESGATNSHVLPSHYTSGSEATSRDIR